MHAHGLGEWVRVCRSLCAFHLAFRSCLALTHNVVEDEHEQETLLIV